LTTIVSIGNGWHDVEGNSCVVANNGGRKLASFTWWHDNVDVTDSTELGAATTMSATAEVTVKAMQPERRCD
jgi:hypothetical protein